MGQSTPDYGLGVSHFSGESLEHHFKLFLPGSTAARAFHGKYAGDDIVGLAPKHPPKP
jgi:hypothetical protein